VKFQKFKEHITYLGLKGRGDILDMIVLGVCPEMVNLSARGRHSVIFMLQLFHY
jgi:hypothetical protein